MSEKLTKISTITNHVVGYFHTKLSLRMKEDHDLQLSEIFQYIFVHQAACLCHMTVCMWL